MAKEYNTIVRELTDLRIHKGRLEKELLSGQQQMIKNKYLSRLSNYKKNGGKEHRSNIQTLKEQVASIRKELREVRQRESQLVHQLAKSSGGFARLAEEMDDRFPILFFPVRIETVFNEEHQQLWIRIFPDEIAVDTHEEILSEAEAEEGKTYWRQFVDGDTEEDKIQAWDLLSRSFSAPRAAYVALQTTPVNLGSVSSGDQLEFPALQTQADTWSKQPETYVMPDAFTVQAYGNDGSELFFEMIPIPDYLKMGIDPTLGPDEDNPDEAGSFDQREVNGMANDLWADETVDWMIDFEAAVEKGMAARIDITPEQFELGFKRVLVVGVKSTLPREESQNRLEQLLRNHHYTDGLSVLKQGSNTNNTDDEYSGFQSVEFGNKVTYQTERLDPLFNPTPINKDKTDGQFLCEALGIEYDTMYHIFRSDGTDIKDVINYNTTNYQALLGYTFTELIPFFGKRSYVNSRFREFTTNYMRSRGALPSIRSGNQPYGILPTSVFSRLDWNDSPDRELFLNVHRYSQSLDLQWTNVLASYEAVAAPGQMLTDVISKHAVSTEYIQRVGVGAGYVWNNIEYAALEFPRQREWQNMQLGRMEQVNAELGLDMDYSYKGLQINYLGKQSNMDVTTVFADANEEEPLPKVSDVGNLLDVLSVASFDELRDENFERYGVGQDVVDRLFNSSMLYRSSRQSVMLEFFEAACDILGIPDEQRGDNELVNQGGERKPEIPNVGPMGALSIGPSRLTIMNTRFEGRTISEVLSSDQVYDFPQAQSLIDAKDSLRNLARVKVKDLSLLVREGIDGVSFRLDTWRLSMVNQRMNELRQIQNGSLNRTMGLYLGAYGWVENLKRREDIVRVEPPTSDGQFPEEILKVNSNKGYIHAPSMNQAVAGAVMLSGYAQRAKPGTEDPLSVNLSSERVRAALDLMEGVRNGQNLGVLLGYEFERKFRELPPSDDTVNVPIYKLRKAYPLDKFVIEVPSDPENVEKISSRNVVNGDKLIELLKEGRVGEIIAASGYVTGLLHESLLKSIDWIWNLADAVADITTTEGIFQVVQGNTIKGGATVNALSKGRLLNEPDVIPSIKQGMEIPQRFTMHFDTENPEETVNNWGSITGPGYRVQAEPYIHKWLCSMLPAPEMITCYVGLRATGTGHWINAQEINLHALDLMYLIGEDLNDGDDLLSLTIKQYVRRQYSYDRSIELVVYYREKDNEETFSLAEIHPVLLYAQKLLNSARHLNTHDYLLPANAEGTIKMYDLDDISGRRDNAVNALISARDNLQTALTSFDKTSVVNALYELSFFGIEQTVYEYVADNAQGEEDLLKQQAEFVIQVINDKLENAAVTEPFPGSADDPTKYIDQILESFKQVLDPNFVALPLFHIHPEDLPELMMELYGATTLTNDHEDNALLTEEWMTSVAKVKKNTGHFEILSILSNTIDPSNSTLRSIVPLQRPYDGDEMDRWLGASVLDQKSLKDGRVVFGVSLPEGHDIGGYQAGIMIDEWIDVVPLKEQTSGVGFHYDQPNAKAPQCLILGLSPQVTGRWQWNDIVDMLEETLDLAKKRGIDYEIISQTAVGQLPGMILPFTKSGNGIGLSEKHVLNLKG